MIAIGETPVVTPTIGGFVGILLLLLNVKLECLKTMSAYVTHLLPHTLKSTGSRVRYYGHRMGNIWVRTSDHPLTSGVDDARSLPSLWGS